eukprot:TRINITY_DN20191_c0_g1_i2.p1 TRINITY_DN20191_c0_g1~~TRINITY_DN20191_c0_g1_i2.p1  ORF type:complete len:568 (+),score=142.83 TRINITY_DN20191_c0_g1_i2:37-1740(+)
MALASADDEPWLTFCTEQGLDEECFRKLMELEPEQREVVCNTFSPKPDTQNISSLFVSFLRSVVQGGKGGGSAKGSGPAPEVDDALRGRVAEFAVTWELDEECIDHLLRERPQVIQDVIAGFAPKSHTSSVRSLFFGYLKSVSSGAKGGARGGPKGGPSAAQLESDMHEFAAVWSLDEECMFELRQQSPQVISEVLNGFAPKGNTRDIRKLFFGYLNSVAAAAGGGKGSKGGGASWNAGPAVRAASSWDEGHGAEVSVWMQNDIARFADQWDLDEQCVQELRRQSPQVISDVLEGFAPKEGTFNPRGLFMKYLRSVVVNQSGGKGPGCKGGKDGKHAFGKGKPGKHSVFTNASWGGTVRATAPRQHWDAAADLQYKSNGGALGQLENEIFAFADHWQLDEDCVQELMQHSPQVINDVIAGFSPKGYTVNLRNLFFSYMNSVAAGSKGKGKADSYGGKADSYGSKGSSRPGPYSRPQTSSFSSPSRFAPAGGAKGGSRPPMDEDIQTFCSTFGLDQKCQEFLQSQDPSVQQEAIAGFKPRADTTNPNGLFMGYLKSVINGMGMKGKGW